MQHHSPRLSSLILAIALASALLGAPGRSYSEPFGLLAADELAGRQALESVGEGCKIGPLGKGSIAIPMTTVGASSDRMGSSDPDPTEVVQSETQKTDSSQARTRSGPQFRFHVQVAAPSDQATATALAKKLATTYRQTVVVDPVRKRGKTYYRIRLRVRTRAEAEELADQLRREQKLNPWIVKAD